MSSIHFLKPNQDVGHCTTGVGWLKGKPCTPCLARGKCWIFGYKVYHRFLNIGISPDFGYIGLFISGILVFHYPPGRP